MQKVYVVDGDASRRADICRSLFSEDFHFEPFDSAEEFLKFMPSLGLVLCHDHFGQLPALIEGLEQRVWLPVVAYSEAPKPGRVVRAMQMGVSSYLGFPLTPDVFRSEFINLQRAFASEWERKKRAVEARRMLETLSSRETEILACMLDYGTSKAIARHLEISPRTVEAHRANLMTRLGVDTAAQAIRIAVEGEVFALANEALAETQEGDGAEVIEPALAREVAKSPEDIKAA